MPESEGQEPLGDVQVEGQVAAMADEEVGPEAAAVSFPPVKSVVTFPSVSNDVSSDPSAASYRETAKSDEPPMSDTPTTTICLSPSIVTAWAAST